jgi:hypothetical protein
MSRASGARKDDWYVIDDVTGARIWGSDVVIDYYGRATTEKDADWAHPQWFIRPKNDPTPPPIIRTPTALQTDNVGALTADQTFVLADNTQITADATVYGTLIFVGKTNNIKNMNNPFARRIFIGV